MQQFLGQAHGPVFLAGFTGIGHRRMTLQQRQHQFAPDRLLLQRGGGAFQQAMELAEAVHQILVAIQRGAEGRQVVGRQFEFGQQRGYLPAVRIKRPVKPAILGAFVAGVQFIGVDQHQRAAARQVFGAAIAITLGAGHDHADHIAVMHVRGETMIDVAGGQ
ncbi:hypothetical protein D3C71_1174690 [compost metagenome]